MSAFMSPDAETVQKDVDTHLGSYVEIMKNRIPLAIQMQFFMVISFGWRVLALMLFGMALMKTGVLSAKRSTSFYRNMMLVGFVIGLPLTV